MIDAPHRARRLALLLPLLVVALPGCRAAQATHATPAVHATPAAHVALAADPLPGPAGADLATRADELDCTTEGVPEGAPTRLADVVVPALDDATLDAWVSHLAPSSDELSWESVDWLPTYAQGVAQAQAQRRPLLLWAMNGHPLGCT